MNSLSLTSLGRSIGKSAKRAPLQLVRLANTMARALPRPLPRLRIISRTDNLTAQRIDVSLILQAMLGTLAAAEYLAAQGVALEVTMRVLSRPGLRRGEHDANGIPM